MWFEFDTDKFMTAMTELFAGQPHQMWLRSPGDGVKFFMWANVEYNEPYLNLCGPSVYNSESMVRCRDVKFCECSEGRPTLYRRGESYFLVVHFPSINQDITIPVQPCYAPTRSNPFSDIDREILAGLNILLADGTLGKFIEVHGEDGGLYVSTKSGLIKFDAQFRGAVRVGRYKYHSICD